MTARQLDLLAADVNNVDPWWLDCALRAIRDLAATTTEPFQAYDLVTVMGLPEPEKSSHWGALFSRAQSDDLIRAAGYAKSKRPTVKGSACAQWRAAR